MAHNEERSFRRTLPWGALPFPSSGPTNPSSSSSVQVVAEHRDRDCWNFSSHLPGTIRRVQTSERKWIDNVDPGTCVRLSAGGDVQKAKEHVALLVCSIEQASMDNGSWDVAFLLSLIEDLPLQVFQDRMTMTHSQVKVVPSHLWLQVPGVQSS